MNSSRAHTQTVLMLIVACAGFAAGCQSNQSAESNQQDWPTTTASNTPPIRSSGTGASEPLPASLGTPPTQTTSAFVSPQPANSNTASSKNWQPGQKLEPFWISMIAEADRAMWDDQFQQNAGPDALALQTLPDTSIPKASGDETADGLMHISFAPEGADFDPAISRDGQFMVYSSTQHRPTADLYLKSTKGGRSITQLTSDPGNDVMPAISPDGQRIAFCSNRSGNWDIYVMSARGGQALQITGDPANELHPSWSPDGKKLVFCRMGLTSGRWELWVMDVGGNGSSEFLGYGMFPQWSPTAHTGLDNRDRILFQRSRERGDRAFSIWTIDYRPGDVSSPSELASFSGQALINASWSPDGERVVYATLSNPAQLAGKSPAASGALPQSNLWMTNVDGTQRVSLTSGSFMNLMPTWGSDGRIYFVSDRTGIPNIWSIGTDKAVFAATGVKMKSATEEPKTDFATAHEEPEAGESHK